MSFAAAGRPALLSTHTAAEVPNVEATVAGTSAAMRVDNNAGPSAAAKDTGIHSMLPLCIHSSVYTAFTLTQPLHITSDQIANGLIQIRMLF